MSERDRDRYREPEKNESKRKAKAETRYNFIKCTEPTSYAIYLTSRVLKMRNIFKSEWGGGQEVRLDILRNIINKKR